ncbi:unnamed protein product, partial [Rotaria magnacalcarata]
MNIVNSKLQFYIDTLAETKRNPSESTRPA